MIGDFILLGVKVTALFLLALVCLQITRRSAPALRHLICQTLLAGSLALLPAMFLPEQAVILHLPSIVAIGGSAGATPAHRSWIEFAKALWFSGCALVTLRFLIGC